jgi:hypothetical protein
MPTYISPTGNVEVWEVKPAGYVTPAQWQAAHPAPEPGVEELAARRRAQIVSDQKALDSVSVRALRALAAGTATSADRQKLAATEAQVQEPRTELAGLSAG